MRILSSRLLAATALVAMAGLALASVVRAATVEELTEKSAVVVEGKVLSQRVVYEGETGRVWTVSKLEVEDGLHGAVKADSKLDVYVPGGRVAGMEQQVSGAAQLTDGARMVLFLWRDDADRLQVLGESQGAFLLVRDRRRDTWIARNDTSGLVLVDAEGERTESRGTELTADELRRRVRVESRRLRVAARAREAARQKRAEEARRRAEERSRTRGDLPGVTPSDD